MLHAVSIDYDNTSDKHLIKRNKIPVVFHPLSTTYIQTLLEKINQTSTDQMEKPVLSWSPLSGNQ